MNFQKVVQTTQQLEESCEANRRVSRNTHGVRCRNGCAAVDIPDENGFVNDLDRIRFLRAHLITLQEAIEEGADVRGYYVWSVLDNFEWERGYSKKFGLIRVDFQTLERIPKQSAYWYRDVIKNHAVQP